MRTRVVPFQLTIASSTLTSVTAADTGDLFTKVAHGLVTGDPVIPTGFSASAGLTFGNRYYVIKASADTFQLATTLALALAGTAVEITSNITGGVIAYATKVSASRALAHSVLFVPQVEGNTYGAYLGHRNSSGKPDPRTPVTVANPSLGYPAEYDLSELWVLTASGDGVDVFGFRAQPVGI